MIIVGDTGVSWEGGKRITEEVWLHDLPTIATKVIDELVAEKYMKPIMDEMWIRLQANTYVVHKETSDYWNNRKRWALEYKPKVRVNYSFFTNYWGAMDRVKDCVKKYMRNNYVYCFSKGVLKDYGDNLEDFQAEQRVKAEEEYARKVSQTPHSVKLAKELRSYNIKVIDYATWAVTSNDYRLVSIAPTPIKKHLKSIYDVNCGKKLDVEKVAKKAYDFVISNITINHKFLKKD